MKYLLALDDTDDVETRGTGFRGRQLARWLVWRRLASVHCISRHQLSQAADIQFTSQNSAVCLELGLDRPAAERLWAECSRAIKRLAAPTAQPGLCLAPLAEVPRVVERFGRRCQRESVQLATALELMKDGIRLASVNKDEAAQGQIGALAAVGLRASGADGRVIWLPGLRSLHGALPLNVIEERTGIAGAMALHGERVGPSERIKLGNWVRPLLRRGEPYLMVRRAGRGEDYEWELLDKAAVKEIDQQ